MSLRSKIVLILFGVVAAYALVDHLLQRTLLVPAFEALENSQTDLNLERAADAIQADADELALRCAALAQWPALERDLPGLAEGLFGPERLNLVFLVGPGGEVLYGAVRRAGQPLAVREFPTQSLSPAHLLLSTDGPIAGVYLCTAGALLAASEPLPAGATGVCGGRLILGRFLDEARSGQLAARAHVEFQVWPLNGSPLPANEQAQLDQVTAEAGPVTLRNADGHLSVYDVIGDVRSSPALLLRAEVPSDVSEQGATAVRYALISTICAGILMLFVLMLLLDRHVLRPIARLTQHAEAIGLEQASPCPLDLERQDEVGVLSREFDAMIRKLALSRAQVVEAARAAGKSEIATGILHNVGNVLNSVTVSAGLLASKLRASRLPQLELLAGMLQEQRADLARFVSQDPRGQKLAPFVEALFKQLHSEQTEVKGELERLSEGVDHIRALVAAQQAYASVSQLCEPASLSELLDRALALTEQASQAPQRVQVERRYEALPLVPLDKHKLLEILVNLLQNARQALDEAGGDAPRLLLALERRPGGLVRLTVADNGPGIRPENLARIFNHGFSTKPNGHGFGLHASANAATELGGKLWAESAGAGQGASFQLEIPIHQAQEAHAA